MAGVRTVRKLKARLLIVIVLSAVISGRVDAASRLVHSLQAADSAAAHAEQAERVSGTAGQHLSPQHSQRSLLADIAIPAALLPVPLGSHTAKPVISPGKWHLLITSCDTRHKWGRMITNTILTALASDLQIASVSISWCRSLSQQLATGKPLPSLLYNMRLSNRVNVFLQSEALANNTKGFITKLLFSQLSIPTVLGNPSLPLIIVEDDIVWEPHAGTILDRLVSAALVSMNAREPRVLTAVVACEQSIGALPDPSLPYVLSLYMPSADGIGPNTEVVREISSLNDTELLPPTAMPSSGSAQSQSQSQPQQTTNTQTAVPSGTVQGVPDSGPHTHTQAAATDTAHTLPTLTPIAQVAQAAVAAYTGQTETQTEHAGSPHGKHHHGRHHGKRHAKQHAKPHHTRPHDTAHEAVASQSLPSLTDKGGAAVLTDGVHRGAHTDPGHRRALAGTEGMADVHTDQGHTRVLTQSDGLWEGGSPHSTHPHLQFYGYGTQGMAFSANMVAKLLQIFVDVLEGRTEERIGLQDVALLSYLREDWKCTIGQGCYFYTVKPSIVQHIGTHSSLFSPGNKTGNPRFHLSRDFPTRIRYPGLESDDLWRRKRRVRRKH